MNTLDPNYGKTWMFFPDESGAPVLIDLSDSDPVFRSGSLFPETKISMWLYNK